jgi:biopolymer transport protein ExbB/TolQ
VERFFSNLKYPLLTFLGIGILMGVLLAGVIGGLGFQQITRLEKENVRLENKVDLQTSHIESLRTVNESLKKKTSKVRIVRPNGEVIETESTESEAHREVAEKVREEYRRELREELREEARLLQKSSPASVGVTASSNRELYVQSKFSVFGNFSLGLGVSKKGTVLGSLFFDF